MRLPAPRGHTSAALIALLRSEPVDRPALLVTSGTRPFESDDDLQLALWILHSRDFDDVHPGWEGHPALLQFRTALESRWEDALRSLRSCGATEVRPANSAQAAEWERHQSFWQPASLRDLQADAYGARDERMHSVLFAVTLRAPDSGSGVDDLPVATLALANALSLFGMHRRWADALAGFLAAVDTMAGDPYAQLAVGSGFRADEVQFGFAVCAALHARLSRHVVDSWATGRSSLRGRWLPIPDTINVGC